MNKLILTVLAVTLCMGSFLLSPCYAKTINAASPSLEDVNSALASADYGDVIAIPAGTARWTRTLFISNHSVTLQGAGVDRTIITNEVPKTGWQDSMIWINSIEGFPIRITGITFAGGSTGGNSDYGVIYMGGTCKNFRIDNCKFNLLKGRAIRTAGHTYGVIDHNIFNATGPSIYVVHNGFNGGQHGDRSWSTPLYLGAANAVYIEDNSFSYTNSDADHVYSVVDSISGGRFVFRYNQVKNSYVINHGLETGGRERSCRSFEIYENTFACDGSSNCRNWFTAMHIRGGTGVIFNNRGDGYQNLIKADYYRTNNSYSPWGRCDDTPDRVEGMGPIDNPPSGVGYPCRDQVGRSTESSLSGVQDSEPLYAWNNTLNGSVANVNNSGNTNIQLGRDYFNGVDKQTKGYSPFTYPHPLTTGSTYEFSVDIVPPQKLRLVN